MKKALFHVIFLVFICSGVFAQQKFAIVIGNGEYTNFGSLQNTINDANDMTVSLQELGFTVNRVINGNLHQMEDAVLWLKNRLSIEQESYGFVFYAGHGVQFGGDNYLIPVNANIPSANHLRTLAFSVQTMLDNLNSAGNALNVVVLDACRDLPAAWSRSLDRGLTVMGRQPADSIIVYATGAGQTASDNIGSRNGLFTGFLLRNLRNHELEVHELFNRTGADVSQASNRQQIPAVYNQFFGTAYLGAGPGSFGQRRTARGTLEIITITAGIVEITGMGINRRAELNAWDHLPVEELNAGNYLVVIRYEDGKTEEKTVEVGRDEIQKVEFAYRPIPPREPRPPREKKPPYPPTQFWSVGVSVGSAFSDPQFTGTVRGTIAPIEYSFLELGVDFGMGSKYETASFFSFYPYANYCFYLPINTERFTWGIYAGIGGGFMFARYTFDEGQLEYQYLSGDAASFNVFSGNIVAGVNILNIIDISYTLRTNFNLFNSKLSIGYTYRFKCRKLQGNYQV